MSNPVKSRWLFLPGLILSLQLCLAQAPSGQVSFSFNTASTAVYDLSGTYHIDQDIVGAGGTLVPLSIIDMPLTHDRSGHLHGSGWIIVSIGGDSFVGAFYNATGRVSGGGNKPTRVTLSVRLHGQDVVTGVQTGFSISVRYNLEVDAASLRLVGSARGHATFTKLSGGNIRSDNLAIPLPPGVDGTWSAQLDMVALQRLVGSGNLVLSNGRTVPVRLTGSFSKRTQLARVHLSGRRVGESDGRGNVLRLNFFSGESTPDFVSGTILGQKVVQ